MLPTPALPTEGSLGSSSALCLLSCSVYEKDNDLVVQEIATRPLTQDLLQHEVRQSQSGLSREKRWLWLTLFSAEHLFPENYQAFHH